MKVNLGIELSDEEREKLAVNWSSKNKLISRQEVRDFVNAKIQIAILGEPPQRQPDAAAIPIAADEPDTEPDRGVRGFVPSRGDEDYLFKSRDPVLKEILARLLDITEELDAYTWQQLEKIRDR